MPQDTPGKGEQMQQDDLIFTGTGDVGLSKPILPDQLHIQSASEEVARLWLKDGQLQFEGNMDKAARALFVLLKNMVDAYIANPKTTFIGDGNVGWDTSNPSYLLDINQDDDGSDFS